MHRDTMGGICEWRESGRGGRRKASQERENKLKETITLATQATVNPETFAGEIF
jgi:hypothetical protein